MISVSMIECCRVSRLGRKLDENRQKTEEHDSEVANYAYHFFVISHFDSSDKCYSHSSYLEIF